MREEKDSHSFAIPYKALLDTMVAASPADGDRRQAERSWLRFYEELGLRNEELKKELKTENRNEK